MYNTESPSLYKYIYIYVCVYIHIPVLFLNKKISNSMLLQLFVKKRKNNNFFLSKKDYNILIVVFWISLGSTMHLLRMDSHFFSNDIKRIKVYIFGIPLILNSFLLKYNRDIEWLFEMLQKSEKQNNAIACQRNLSKVQYV